MRPSPTRSRRIKAAIRCARIASAKDDLDRRLADRRQGRDKRNESARAAAATRIHIAHERDRLLNERVAF